MNILLMMSESRDALRKQRTDEYEERVERLTRAHAGMVAFADAALAGDLEAEEKALDLALAAIDAKFGLESVELSRGEVGG